MKHVLVCILLVHLSMQTPVFLVHPKSIAAVDGSTVEFTCTANDTENMLYRVNNTAASSGSVTNKGFTQSSIDTIDTLVTTRNLSVTVSSVYNNTVIFCRARNGAEVDSNKATLTVQGPLSSIDGLSYSIDCSTINISWNPPFTLPGTHITGYNISETTGNGTTTDYFTFNSHYLLSLTDITDSPYNDFTSQVTVSGYNGLDKSESSSITISIPSATVDVTVENISSDGLLSLQANLTVFCVDDIVTVTLLKGGMIDNSTSTLASNTISLTNVFELTEDQNYTVNVSYAYFEKTNVIQNFTDFDTYGVQSLDVTDTSEDTVYIVCLFNTFSTDSGCTVVLVLTTDQQQQYNGTFNKMDDNTASGNITDVDTGVYNIRAFDQGSNVVAVELLSIVTITGETSSTTISSTASLKPPSNSTINIPTRSATDAGSTPSIENSTSDLTVVTSDPSITLVGVASDLTAVYIAIPVGVVIILLVLVVVILLGCFIYKKKNKSEMKTTSTSSDTFIPSPPNDDKSPTNPYPSQNLDDLYSRPNMAAKTNAQSVVYADLSIIQKQVSVKNNKPHPSPIRNNTRVVYSDLLLKGQPPPPPYEPIELKQQPSSVTVIPPTITVKENKDEEITEFFFSHPGRDDDDGVVTVPASSRPPPPDGRAPSPPTEDPAGVPPPIPSRSHDSRLPDVVHQYNITSDNEYGDESLHPALEEFRSEKDDHKGFMNTPTATYL